MNKSRLLGRDVQIRIAQAGVPLATVTAIKNFTFEVRVRNLKDQLLGETGQRQDEIFDEVGGTFVIQPEDPEVLTFMKFVADRAIARSFSEGQVTINFRCTFPNGSIARVVIPNPAFDPIPFNASGRDAYVETSVTYAAEGFTLIT